jgi:hypothetical protein
MKTVQFETTKIHGLFVKIDDFKEMKREGIELVDYKKEILGQNVQS